MDPTRDDSPQEREQRRTRLENEIQEILERTDRPPSNVVKFRSQVRTNRVSYRQRLESFSDRVRITELNLLVAAIVLAVLAFVLGDSSRALGSLLAILSVAAVVWLFVRYYRRPGHQSIKTWRGRDVDLTPPRRSDWLERRLGGRRGPRR